MIARPAPPPAVRLLLVAVLSLAVACGGGDDLLPALTDDSTCEEAVDIVTTAIGEAQAYIGTEADDPARAVDLVFALSAVDERPECFDTDLSSQARGLRTTLDDLAG